MPDTLTTTEVAVVLVPTPDYKSIALRLYGYGKFAEDYGYREEYWSQLRAIGVELGVADIENPEDLGIPWPPTATES